MRIFAREDNKEKRATLEVKTLAWRALVSIGEWIEKIRRFSVAALMRHSEGRDERITGCAFSRKTGGAMLREPASSDDAREGG